MFYSRVMGQRLYAFMNYGRRGTVNARQAVISRIDSQFGNSELLWEGKEKRRGGSSEQKAEFDDAAGLRWFKPEWTKSIAGCDVAGADVGNIGACKELLVLVSRSGCDGPCCATRTVQQIGRILSVAAGAADVFPASSDAEALLQDAGRKNGAAPGGCAGGEALSWIGGNVAVLKVRLNDPGALRIRVNQGIHRAVVLNRGLQAGPVGCSQVSHPLERQAMRAVSVGQCSTESGVTVGIETIVVTESDGDLAQGLVELDTARNGIFLVP